MQSRISPSELSVYLRTLLFGLFVFGACYLYTIYLKIPSPLNKSAADTSIILIGFSMWLSSLSYFFNIFDTKITYRKQLGLIGFAFGIMHIALSFSLLKTLLSLSTWQHGALWAPLTGLGAALIFTLMTFISRRSAMIQIGILRWRMMLRSGYIAMLLVWLHIVILKSPRWITWFTGGMKTLPSLSLVDSGFILVVICMRILMWWRIKQSTQKAVHHAVS